LFSGSLRLSAADAALRGHPNDQAQEEKRAQAAASDAEKGQRAESAQRAQLGAKLGAQLGAKLGAQHAPEHGVEETPAAQHQGRRRRQNGTRPRRPSSLIIYILSALFHPIATAFRRRNNLALR